jgi:DNA repair ATPase RecN
MTATTVNIAATEKELRRLEADLAMKKDQAQQMFDAYMLGTHSMDRVSQAKSEIAALTKEVEAVRRRLADLKNQDDPARVRAQAVLRDIPPKHQAAMSRVHKAESDAIERLHDIQDLFFAARDAHQEAFVLEREAANAAATLEQTPPNLPGTPKILSTPAMSFMQFVERLVSLARSGIVESPRGAFRWNI